MSASYDLAEKRVLVTGGATGIGLATAELFALFGATVAVNHLPGDPAGPREVKRLKGEGRAVLAAPGDISDAAGAAAMVEAAVAAMGGLDYLVNNAATFGTKEPIPMADLDAIDDAFWSNILSVNLVGPRSAAPRRRPGR